MFEILGIINRPRAEPSWSHLPLHVGVGVERGAWSVAAWTYPYNVQTSPLRPRLVVSRSTCPPLSPSPQANSFVIGTAGISTYTCSRKALSYLKLRVRGGGAGRRRKRRINPPLHRLRGSEQGP